MRAPAWVAIGYGVAMPLVHALAFSAEQSGALRGARQELPFPSVGRVVLGFLFVVALAVGAAFALRRWWPALLNRRQASTNMRTLDRAVVSPSLKVYLVEVAGERFVIAEGRSGVAVTRSGQGAEAHAEVRP